VTGGFFKPALTIFKFSDNSTKIVHGLIENPGGYLYIFTKYDSIDTYVSTEDPEEIYKDEIEQFHMKFHCIIYPEKVRPLS